jgi:hypothetical protein
VLGIPVLDGKEGDGRFVDFGTIKLKRGGFGNEGGLLDDDVTAFVNLFPWDLVRSNLQEKTVCALKA